jgi:DNA-directed RNA polymerase
MPNLIHSLDAASLALLADTLYKDNPEIFNFYAIHDCFAMTANNIEQLIANIQLVFYTMYSNEKYLHTFDNGVKEMILLQTRTQ